MCVFIPDGLFGQCRTSKQDQVQYQVSVPVLKRMQEVLKQLMLQGLSWQDDITQYILSKELKRVLIPPFLSYPTSLSILIFVSVSLLVARSKQHIPHHQSSKSRSASPGGKYVDYMIVEPPQSPLRMQTHRYQDDVERSLLGAGGSYARPSSRSQANQRERERDRQLLQEALSLYLASAQPSYRHRGAASMTPAGKRFRTELQFNLKMQLLKTDSVSNKPEKPAPAPAPSPPNAPLAPSSASVLATPPAKSANLHLSASQPPQAAPAEAGHGLKEQGLPLVEGTGAKEEYGYIVTNQSVVGPALTFRIRQNEHNMTAAEVAAKAVTEKNFLESETGLKIVQTGVGERTDARRLPQVTRVSQGSSGTVITLVSMAVVGGVLVLAMAVACLRHYAQQVANGKLGLGPEGGAETHFDYQELCRQHMASKSSLCRQDCVGGVSGGVAGSAVGTGAGGRRGTDTSRVSSVSSQFSDGPQHSPSSTHSSTPSWSEEPAQSNMDISTGHMILTYMEDHLRNKDRLQKEWEALCSYQAEPSSVAVAQVPNNMDKNRHAESLPYDHSRVKLKTEVNPSKQDYINASIIFDHDPRQPAYIATQGPLPHTVADFWQMVWENGCTVIVMMTALVEDGEKQCERYWPDEGSSLYHIYEVNLVSEHIWCKDFLVRSFYLKNVQTQETRTLTQFHLLSWPADGIPTSTRPLLDFRRKVNKCYRGRSCPIIVHCSDGTGRTGTYILIDMVLNRMAKGVKEIDIAATLEHIRDQRPGLVRTKDQFEFALTAVAEEVNAILKALPQ
uniref:Protein tyrosine phosphatase receptor type Na n=1 Tax=Amphiprion ocellaris TaxID=80972 RepID=A0AAQ5Y379_AMPOC